MSRKPRRNYPDWIRYTVYVLFMHGYSYGQIATKLNALKIEPVTRENVGAILRRSEYYGRKEMTLEQRQSHLDLLKQYRDLSGDIKLEEWAFIAQPLDDKRQQ